jgi:hypothetical protein
MWDVGNTKKRNMANFPLKPTYIISLLEKIEKFENLKPTSAHCAAQKKKL